jgi:uncharacterized protein (TIGR03663 family)
MSRARLPDSDEWRLGPPPQEDHELVPLVEPERKTNLSTARLTRPVHVVTVENLAWGGMAIWAIVTRFIELGMVPLAPHEARHALFEYDLVNGTNWAAAAGYHPASAGWIHLVEAGLFAVAGATDSVARLIFVAAGLSIMPIAYLMRPYVGRAGAIALASLITVSPTFTYFSRTSTLEIATAALAMAVVAAFMAFSQGPTLLKAIGFGCGSGLLCASMGGLVVGGIFLVVLTLLGVYQLIFTKRAFLNARIWLKRYASSLIVAIVAAALLWCASEASLFKAVDIARNIKKLWLDFMVGNYLAGLKYYAPEVLLYDFLILLAAIFGLIVIVFLRQWSGFAAFCLFWTLVSCAYFLGAHQRESQRLVLMLLPLTFVGALGIDYLHQTDAWPYARIALIALGAVAAYVQVLSSFKYAAPAANETPWERHANLYWREGATPAEARADLNEIRQRFPGEGGTVFSRETWQPSLRWYLRDFRPSDSAKTADLVINPNPPAVRVQHSDVDKLIGIEIQESWNPRLDGLTLTRAIHFVFTADAWSPLQTDAIAIMVRPRLDLAPTLIVPPPQH